MRLVEFYNPEEDQYSVFNRTDSRKPKLTLRALNKLRNIKELKRAEEIEHLKFVQQMYGPKPEEGDLEL